MEAERAGNLGSVPIIDNNKDTVYGATMHADCMARDVHNFYYLGFEALHRLCDKTTNNHNVKGKKNK